MNSRWRGALFVVTLLVTSAFLVQPVAAQKGAGLFPAGIYRLSFAGADFSGSSNNLQIPFFDVTSGAEIARPDGAPGTSTSETNVSFFLIDSSTFTFTYVCASLDHPGDFVIDSRLGSATLNTTLTPQTRTCSGSPLTSTIAISARWTGIGPLAKSTGASNYSCEQYTAQGNGGNLTNTATANLALTIGATTTSFSSSRTALHSNDFQVEAHGAIDPGCGPTGFGIGPTPAGHIRFSGLFAEAFFMPPTGGFNRISLITSNQPSSPDDVDVSFFGGSIDGFGCFAVQPSDVTTNGLLSAAVHTTINNSTPLCPHVFPGFGLNFPLTVNAAWTATGPLMTLHDQNNYQCLGYTQATSTFVEDTGANSVATVTMPDFLGNPVTLDLSGGFASLTQVTQSTQAQGELPLSCLVRA